MLDYKSLLLGVKLGQVQMEELQNELWQRTESSCPLVGHTNKKRRRAGRCDDLFSVTLIATPQCAHFAVTLQWAHLYIIDIT